MNESEVNEIQFARILDALETVGALTPAVIDRVAAELDLSPQDAGAVIEYARHVFECGKRRLAEEPGAGGQFWERARADT
jgi:hypothetical protein